MKTVLYITYIDFGDFKSGSSVRPQKMYDAFLEVGCQVKLLQTQQNRRKERAKAVKEINCWLDSGNRPDFCYVESPSGPIFNRCDKVLLKKIRKLGIPLGYFYRDAAYRFDQVFVRGKKSLKQHAIAWMSEQDVRFLEKNVDLLYFPTKSMASYFQFKNVAYLPPACSGVWGDKLGRVNKRRCIYVGGVSKRYGTNTLLAAFDSLNGGTCSYPLTLICRKPELSYIEEAYLKMPWLKIVHASGREQLAPYYQEADLALYPIEKNVYNDFAFSVKLMEYLEYGLPVVSVNCTEAERFINYYKTGLVCKNDPVDFAEKVRMILEDQTVYEQYAKNVALAVQGNLWSDRAKKVEQDLTSLQKG